MFSSSSSFNKGANSVIEQYRTASNIASSLSFVAVWGRLDTSLSPKRPTEQTHRDGRNVVSPGCPISMQNNNAKNGGNCESVRKKY